MKLDLFDYDQIAHGMVHYIEEFFRVNNGKIGVLGISGGKDSTALARAACIALGKENVIGVMMPNGTQADINDSLRVVNTLGIQHCTVNIEKPYNAEIDAIVEAYGGDKFVRERLAKDTQAGINLAPRIRMQTLYGIAQMQEEQAFVINTTNLSEAYVGYGTLWGDTAGDLAPLANCTVEMVIEIGRALGLPDDLMFKTPSDGLSGMSDEDKLGVTYDEIQRFILKQCNFLGTNINYGLSTEAEERIKTLYNKSKFKRSTIRINSYETPLSRKLAQTAIADAMRGE